MKEYGTIHEIFEKTAQAYPEKTAIIDDDEIITYAQLNEQANTIAFNLNNLKIRSSALPIANRIKIPPTANATNNYSSPFQRCSPMVQTINNSIKQACKI